jgi:hypothetical protein
MISENFILFIFTLRNARLKIDRLRLSLEIKISALGEYNEK